MDPDANVREQERILERAAAGGALPGDTERLEDLPEALAAWLARGGYAPTRLEALSEALVTHLTDGGELPAD